MTVLSQWPCLEGGVGGAPIPLFTVRYSLSHRDDVFQDIVACLCIAKGVLVASLGRLFFGSLYFIAKVVLGVIEEGFHATTMFTSNTG